MEETNLVSLSRLEDGRFLSGNRKTILYAITLICSITFFPLAAKNFAIGYYWLGGFLLAFAISLCINALAIQSDFKYSLNYNIVVILLVISEIMTVYRLGIYGIFWAYPIIIALMFLLPLKVAGVYCSFMACAITAIAFWKMELGIALRVMVSLASTIGVSSLLLNFINNLQEQLRKESICDPMTGAFNRRQLDVSLNDCIAQYHRYESESYILMIDIDCFKNINDNFGHEVGDSVIKKIVSIIKANTREVDMLFRLGGDEFLLLLRYGDVGDALAIAEKIRVAIERERIVNNHTVTVSIGGSGMASDTSINTWMQCADKALYQSKEGGRNRVEIYQ